MQYLNSQLDQIALWFEGIALSWVQAILTYLYIAEVGVSSMSTKSAFVQTRTGIPIKSQLSLLGIAFMDCVLVLLIMVVVLSTQR